MIQRLRSLVAVAAFLALALVLRAEPSPAEAPKLPDPPPEVVAAWFRDGVTRGNPPSRDAGNPTHEHVLQSVTSTEEYPLDRYWHSGFEGSHVEGEVNAAARYNGKLVIGGFFRAAGGVPGTAYVAQWSDSTWQPLGHNTFSGPESELNGEIHALAEYRGDLYAGGATGYGTNLLDRIARWNGTSWDTVGSGTNGRVRALRVYGDELVVAGHFTRAGRDSINRIATWDGASWDSLGVGFNEIVLCLSEHNGNLVAGGLFTALGDGTPASRLAQWGGSTWTEIGGIEDGSIRAVASYQGSIVVGGDFTTAGGVPGTSYLARWDGASWHALGSGVNYHVNALLVKGDTLLVGGHFTSAGGAPAYAIAQWDGTSWSDLDQGLLFEYCCVSAWVNFLALDGDRVIVGGLFTLAGNQEANYIATWDGSNWDGEFSNSGSGLSNDVTSLASYNGSLIAGGVFLWGSGLRLNGIARWDGSSWWNLGAGLNGGVWAMAIFSGDLIAGGSFTVADRIPANRIARWDGLGWSQLGSGVNDRVRALYVHKGDLYVGGEFTEAGGSAASGVARWDGISWHPVDTGVSGGWPETRVYSFAEFDSMLVMGGKFQEAGGLDSLGGVVSWDGASWHALGTGVEGFWDMTYDFTVYDLEAYEGSLVAGGHFSAVDGLPIRFIAKWNGTSWDSIGYAEHRVYDIDIHEDDLVVSGTDWISSWNGYEWIPLTSEVDARVWTLTSHDGSVYVGGEFQTVGTTPSLHIARWTSNKTGVPWHKPRLLFTAYPNPFRASTHILYELDHPGLVRLTVFDVQGRRVARLVDTVRDAGQYKEMWTGRDDLGRHVSSGVYYLKLKAGEQSGVRKVVLHR